MTFDDNGNMTALYELMWANLWLWENVVDVINDDDDDNVVDEKTNDDADDNEKAYDGKSCSSLEE